MPKKPPKHSRVLTVRVSDEDLATLAIYLRNKGSPVNSLGAVVAASIKEFSRVVKKLEGIHLTPEEVSDTVGMTEWKSASSGFKERAEALVAELERRLAADD